MDFVATCAPLSLPVVLLWRRSGEEPCSGCAGGSAPYSILLLFSDRVPIRKVGLRFTAYGLPRIQVTMTTAVAVTGPRDHGRTLDAEGS